MMIDFSKLATVVPNNGTLHLIFMKGKDGKITVIYAPKFTDKETDNVLRPLKIQDTPENLTATFETNITDLSAKQRIYADDFRTRTEEIDKALSKKAATPAKNTRPASKTTSKTQDLLTGSPAASTESTEEKEETEEGSPETEAAEDETTEAGANAEKTEEPEENLFD